MIERCDRCEFWAQHPENPLHGTCYGGPPTAQPNGAASWPMLPADTRACGTWRLAERLCGGEDARAKE